MPRPRSIFCPLPGVAYAHVSISLPRRTLTAATVIRMLSHRPTDAAFDKVAANCCPTVTSPEPLLPPLQLSLQAQLLPSLLSGFPPPSLWQSASFLVPSSTCPDSLSLRGRPHRGIQTTQAPTGGVWDSHSGSNMVLPRSVAYEPPLVAENRRGLGTLLCLLTPCRLTSTSGHYLWATWHTASSPTRTIRVSAKST